MPRRSGHDHGQLVTAGSLKLIDWDAMHTCQANRASTKGKGPDFWNRYAWSPSIGEIDQNYINALMPRLNLSPDTSVMDIGCGNGGISIALAKKAGKVIALDYALAAIKSTQKKAQEANLKNLTYVCADFSKVKVGQDIEVCDAVLASRSLPMGNLRKTLLKINAAARRVCYLVSGSSNNELAEWICARTGIELRPFPEYMIIPSMLYTMNIHANIEIFNVKGTYYFDDLDEAFYATMFGYDIQDAAIHKKTLKMIQSKLLYQDNRYVYNFRKEFALIWWEK